jgi:hypothetical protein
MRKGIENSIFSISSNEEFVSLALDIFRFQASSNQVYASFIDHLGIDCTSVRSLEDIPFMPISFFRDQKVVSGKFRPETTFVSSGTTGTGRSNHLVKNLSVYERSVTEGFRLFYGEPSSYALLALLPSYLERDGSSLAYMAGHLIRKTGKRESGFYLDDLEGLLAIIKSLRSKGTGIILLGVSFALLDLAERFGQDLPGTIIMETGGMKGRRKEIIREDLHDILKSSFGIDKIHSEYGMTELLSQAYSRGEGIFYSPPWMKVMIRDHLDPGVYVPEAVSGGINIIDLANVHSCSFIETSDLGKSHNDGGFEVLGRFDNSDIRGCNLLVDQ